MAPCHADTPFPVWVSRWSIGNLLNLQCLCSGVKNSPSQETFAKASRIALLDTVWGYVVAVFSPEALSERFKVQMPNTLYSPQ